MAESFDPYHRWLGIRDPQRPPNHYRLLGLDLFEDDRDVIAEAADRQMAHVRTFQLGPHSALSQQLLNELAAAKVCLLDSRKKANYDHELRSLLRTPELAASRTAMSHDTDYQGGPVQLPSDHDERSTSRTNSETALRLGLESQKARRDFLAHWVGSMAAAALVAGVVGFLLARLTVDTAVNLALTKHDPSDSVRQANAARTNAEVAAKDAQRALTGIQAAVQSVDPSSLAQANEARTSAELAAKDAQSALAKIQAAAEGVDASAKEYPLIAGTWWEGEGKPIPFAIIQHGNRFVADCVYTFGDTVGVHAIAWGTISKDGDIAATLIHLKPPQGWMPQIRTGKVSADGKTITGHAMWATGEHDFVWTRKDNNSVSGGTLPNVTK